MTVTFVLDGRTLAIGLAALALFGAAYNWWVARVVRSGQERGYLALIVALGVGVTAIGFALVTGWINGVVLLVCFVASGTPMILGSIERYVKARSREESQALRRAKEALHE